MLEIDRDGFDQWDKRIIETLDSQIQWRAGRLEFARGRDRRGSRHARRSERAVFDHGRLHQAHAARPRGDAERLSQTRIETAGVARRASCCSLRLPIHRSSRAQSRDPVELPLSIARRGSLDCARDDGVVYSICANRSLLLRAKVLTVAELTRAIRGTLETRFGAVWVQGEISNYKLHPSGHQYFTLKDQRAQIACVIFRNTPLSLRQPLADGAQVQVYGNVTVFEARGQYQLSVQIVQPRGPGCCRRNSRRSNASWKRKDCSIRRARDRSRNFPKRIGIITSPSGAAIRDMLNVLRRRAPRDRDSDQSGARAGNRRGRGNRHRPFANFPTQATIWPPLDVIVVARGGGSIEDLWEFNEEIVARAISAAARSGRERGRTRNRFHDCRFRGRSARADAERRGGIDRARCGRTRPARE